MCIASETYQPFDLAASYEQLSLKNVPEVVHKEKWFFKMKSNGHFKFLSSNTSLVVLLQIKSCHTTIIDMVLNIFLFLYILE